MMKFHFYFSRNKNLAIYIKAYLTSKIANYMDFHHKGSEHKSVTSFGFY